MCKWTSDSQRFLLEHFDTIHDSPSHIYHSALPFSPSSSWLHGYYGAELPPEVKVVKGLPDGWGACSRTVSLDTPTLALSYWNNTIAVGSKPGDTILLDAITGSQRAILSGHTGEINTLAFSPDGKSLVSGSDDQAVKLWDVQTGGVIKTFFGHTLHVWSVSISIDCTRIASGSGDRTIRLWDIQTGECQSVIKQQGTVFYISFSPNAPQHLLSICNDKIWQWDINGHQVGPTYDGSHIAFSLDGTQFVSCKGMAVTVQNSSSGVIVAEFHVASDDTKYCCFSPDGRFVAVAAQSIAYVWDITNSKPQLVETFIGHTHYITSLAFSSPSSLISVSEDSSVKFWQIGTPDPTMTGLSLASTPMKSTTLQAKDGIIITSSSDGIVRTWDISTGLCRESFQTPAEDFHMSDAQLINDRLIFIWYANEKINIWDVKKGELLLGIGGPMWSVEDLRISGDGSRVFCLGIRSIQAWSIETGEVVSEMRIGYSARVGSLTVDGSRIWVHYPNSEDQGWDLGILGSLPVQLPNIPPYRLHPNGVMLWDTGLSRIKDKVTGKVVFQLSKRYGKPLDVQWNSHYLVICFTHTEALILDFSHMFL